MINVCIVHYNTPKLTECLVRSINKYTPNSVIYIFDNSDKDPFTYKVDNVKYIDNTKGQIIDFEKWLQKYPNRVSSPGKLNRWGSAKHCYSIEKCIDIINDNFILLDSDILLTRDISSLCDDSKIYVAEVTCQPRSTIKRVVPYICFLNVKMMKKNGVHYFDENHMHGLRYTVSSDMYDTGAGFYIAAKKFPSREINTNEYAVHYSGGSWAKEKELKYKHTFTPEQWLDRYKKYWDDTPETFTEYKEGLLAWGKRHGIKYNINHPVTIQDKIQWLKIYDTTPLKTKCADKIKVHEYCKEKLGKDICIPIIKTYNKSSEINWDELPNSFVIKCNHGSGMNIIVKDKNTLDKKGAAKKLDEWLTKDFAFSNGYEMQYHNIDRKIFVEEYKADKEQTESLYDYKFWCFNGVPKFYTINDGHGHGDIMYYDMNHKEMDPYMVGGGKYTAVPPQFDTMVKYATDLSADFKFVRADFYFVGGKLYLGELTFTPGSGCFKYKDAKYEKIFGDMLDLGKKKNVIYTCITGGYDKLITDIKVSENFDYVCFTDDMSLDTGGIWELRKMPEEVSGYTKVKQQRYVKICAHKVLPEYENSIWVDAIVNIRGNVDDFIKDKCNSDSTVFIPAHPSRACIYKEGAACKNLKKDTAANIDPQLDRYRKDGYPDNSGLVQSIIMYRKHNTPSCIKLMEKWWEELSNGSHRDQLSFNYALWKTPEAKFTYLDKKTCESGYFLWGKKHGKSITSSVPKSHTVTSQKGNSVTQAPVAQKESLSPKTLADKNFMFGDSLLGGGTIKQPVKYKPQTLKYIGRNRPKTKSMKAILSI